MAGRIKDHKESGTWSQEADYVDFQLRNLIGSGLDVNIKIYDCLLSTCPAYPSGRPWESHELKEIRILHKA